MFMFCSHTYNNPPLQSQCAYHIWQKKKRCTRQTQRNIGQRKQLSLQHSMPLESSGFVWIYITLGGLCVLSHVVPAIGNNSYPKSYHKCERIPLTSTLYFCLWIASIKSITLDLTYNQMVGFVLWKRSYQEEAHTPQSRVRLQDMSDKRVSMSHFFFLFFSYPFILTLY